MFVVFLARHRVTLPYLCACWRSSAGVQMTNDRGLLALQCLHRPQPAADDDGVGGGRASGGRAAAAARAMKQLLVAAGSEFVDELRGCTEDELRRRAVAQQRGVVDGVASTETVAAKDDPKATEKLVQWHVRVAAAVAAGAGNGRLALQG